MEESPARLLEVCVDSLDSALLAAQGGADRLELCAALSEGGLTPSIGLLIAVKKLVKIPVFVLVRCRQGDFVYSANDMVAMEADILNLKSHGADGFVFGCLKENGVVEEEQCGRLLSAAAPLPCTFHRAFDCVSAPELALETVIRLGFTRVLTSGLARTALEGSAVIARLVSLSAGRLSVMAGGGVSASTAAQLAFLTGVTELHASARAPRYSSMSVPAGVSMGASSDERCWLECNPQEVNAIKRALSSADEKGDA